MADLRRAEARLDDLLRNADEQDSLAPGTLRVYAYELRAFERWAREHGLEPVTDDDAAAARAVALYLADVAEGLSWVSVRRKASAIAWAYVERGLPSPTRRDVVRQALLAIRERKAAPVERERVVDDVEAHLTPELAAMLDALPDTVAGKRDRALILLGAATRLRRSELAALRVEDVRLPPVHLVVRCDDANGKQGPAEIVVTSGATRPDHDPAEALTDWLEAARIHDGPIFRPLDKSGEPLDRALSDRSVTLAVKRAAEGAGLDPSRFSAEYLRRCGRARTT